MATLATRYFLSSYSWTVYCACYLVMSNIITTNLSRSYTIKEEKKRLLKILILNYLYSENRCSTYICCHQNARTITCKHPNYYHLEYWNPLDEIGPDNSSQSTKIIWAAKVLLLITSNWPKCPSNWHKN